MYQEAVRSGVSPESFWKMTIAEVACCCDRLGRKDRLAWNHTASIMSLVANVNSAKGKTFEPAQFNPYSKMDVKKGQKATPKDLLEQFKKF